MDRGAGRRLLPPLRRRPRIDRPLPAQVCPQGRRPARSGQRSRHRARRHHRRAGAGSRPSQRGRQVAADRRLRGVRVRRLLGRRAQARGLGRYRGPRRLADARLSLDQRRRRRDPRRRSPLGQDHRRRRGRDPRRARRPAHPHRDDRAGRRAPRALRLHRQRPERGGRTYRDGRGHGREEAQGHRRPRQDPRQDRRSARAHDHRQVGLGHDGPEAPRVPRVRHRGGHAGQEPRGRHARAELPHGGVGHRGQGRRGGRARPRAREDGRVLRVLGALQEGRAHRAARGGGAGGRADGLQGPRARGRRSAGPLPRRSALRRPGVRIAGLARREPRPRRPHRHLQVQRDVQLPRHGHGLARRHARVGDGMLREGPAHAGGHRRHPAALP